MSRPPWWRPFARRRYDRARGHEQIVAIATPHPDAFLESMRQRLAERSRRLRDRLNTETDTEAVDADTRNGVPFYALARQLRNREGEQ